MKTLPLSEAKAKLSGLVAEVSRRDARITITRNGRPAAVLMSHDEAESLDATLEIMSDPAFYAEILRGKRALESGRARLYATEEVFGPEDATNDPKAGRVRRRRTRRHSGARAGAKAKGPRRARRTRPVA